MYTSGPMGTIVLVDDDQNINDLLRSNLGSEGFGVHVEREARNLNLDGISDVRMIIVDAMNQPYSGIDLTRDIKSNVNTADIPIIICTAGDGEDAIVNAFDSGADDFIAKPFSLRELLARVRAVLRRHPRKKTPESHLQQHGLSVPSLKLNIDLASQRVVEDGIVVPLTKTEFSILVFLLKNQNSFFTRNEICVEVWKDDAGSNARIVDTNISRLRKKLGESGKYIINRYGMGYAFVDKLA